MVKKTTDLTPKPRSWGLVVVLVLLVLLLGGGLGTYAGSNALAQSSYSTRIANGEALAVVKIPAFGQDYEVPVVEGTDLDDLRQGLGWYIGTSRPGEVGNCGLAGHRIGWGEPFAHLGDLAVGDEILVIQGGDAFHYLVITGPTIVPDDYITVLAPVPGDTELRPTKALLTLTTAASLLPSPNRMVVIAELVHTDSSGAADEHDHGPH